MIGWGPLHWWARTVSNRRHLLCKPGANHKTVWAGQQPHSSTKPVSGCLHRLTPQLTVTDRSIWHGSGTRGTTEQGLAIRLTATGLPIDANYRHNGQ